MSSRRPLFFILAALAIIVVAACCGVFARVHVTRVTPAPNSFLADKNPRFVVEYTGWALDTVVQVDGKKVESNHHDRTISFQPRGLAEGEHDLQLTLRQGFALGEVHWTARIVVDTVPPQIHLDAPTEGTITGRNKLEVSGHTESFATVHLSCGAAGGKTVSVTTEADGRFHATLDIPEGKDVLEIVSIDRAGNRHTLRRNVLCDLTPPEIKDVLPAEGARVTVDRPTIKVVVAEKGSGVKQVTLSIDGHPPIDLGYGDARDGGEGAVVRFKTGELAEGLRRVHLTVEDAAGNKTEKQVQFLVDSTEVLGPKVVTFGAVGADVAQLQKRLVKFGYLDPGQVTSRFDDPTLEAVKQFQKERHLTADGILGGQSIAQMLPRIVVNLARFSLVLLDGDEPVRRYAIACGQPKYPTPSGEYRIADLVANPTWIPPNSVWAREAKTIPPGPGNPLGTRWIGFNSNEVGIHGTNADWTIGTRASHGCMRMHIRDVEDLYPLVTIGMKVTIYKGTEKSPDIQRLWSN